MSFLLKEFLLSEGTNLSPATQIPLDPYESSRLQRRETPLRSSCLRPNTSDGSSLHYPNVILK